MEVGEGNEGYGPVATMEHQQNRDEVTFCSTYMLSLKTLFAKRP